MICRIYFNWIVIFDRLMKRRIFSFCLHTLNSESTLHIVIQYLFWYIMIFWGHHLYLYQGHLVQQYFMLSFEIAVCLKHWIFCVIVIFASIPILLMTISPFTTWHVNKKCCISILYHIVRRHLVFVKNERIGKLVYKYVAGIIAINIR